MPYSHTTLAQMKTELANRLSDTSKLFWTDSGSYSELGIYILEALRTWSAMTGFWTGRGVFQSTQGAVFYDLSSSLSTLLGYTVKDKDLVAAIQYHLLEPATPSAWSGSDQFTLDDVTKALERRRNQFLLETGIILTRSLIDIAPPSFGRITIPDSVIDIGRVAWRSVDAEYTQLWREDEWAFNAFAASWSLSPTTPSVFSVSATPPLVLQLAPAPIDVGQLELVSVATGATLDPTSANGVLLGIPDDFSWVIKWGALADLLNKDGHARDVTRAEYCERRWREGIRFARMSTTVLEAYINDSPVFVSSLFDLDTQRQGWQNTVGAPDALAMGGWNLLALSKSPDAGPYSMTLDVVRNAPVPTVDADQIQIGREELDAILGYAQYLAMFKTGGSDFLAAEELYRAFLRLAAQRNDRLETSGLFQQSVRDRTVRERTQRRRPAQYEYIDAEQEEAQI